MKSTITIFFILLIIPNLNYGQTGMGVGTSNPAEKLDVNGAIKIGTTTGNTDGTIRWTGSDFEGRKSGVWVSLTGGGGGGNTLDEAYNQGGPGAGRIINANDGAMRIDGEDGFIVTGTFGSGDIIEATGQGTRMFFVPRRASFRVGYVSGTQWDDNNSGPYSIAAGHNTTARGSYSTAFGQGTTAMGNYSVALGQGSTANGINSTTMGLGTMANAINSTALGESTTAWSRASIAMGWLSEAGGLSSVAMGYNTRANGGYCTTMGYNTLAAGRAAVATGENTTATGDNTTTTGFGTVASSYVATAMGLNTTASGSSSTSMGEGTIASGYASTAMGENTTAKSYAETVIGRYNTNYSPSGTISWSANDRLFVVGNGTSSVALSNALTILKNGNIGIGTDSPTTKLEVNGFTKMGVNSPAIKTKYLTGILNPTVGGSPPKTALIAHGLVFDEIIAVNVLIEEGPGSIMLPPSDGVLFQSQSNYEYIFDIDVTNVRIHVNTNPGALVGKDYRILITYCDGCN